MAFVADQTTVEPGNPAAFAPIYTAGTPAPWSGIYRCVFCGWEAVSTKGHPLPPQHLGHQHALPIAWRLVAGARHV
jgi:hypothetical protein